MLTVSNPLALTPGVVDAQWVPLRHESYRPQYIVVTMFLHTRCWATPSEDCTQFGTFVPRSTARKAIKRMPKLTHRPRKSKKITLAFTEREYELLGKLARESDKDLADVIRGAIKMRDFLETNTADGSQVILRRDREDPEIRIVSLDLFR